MSEFLIEHGIPIPPVFKPKRQLSYSWRGMGLLDSFLVPNGNIRTVTGAAHNYSVRHGTAYTCRTVKGGVRVWRVV